MYTTTMNTIIYLAHAGESHESASESLSHALKTSWPLVLLVTALTVAAILVVVQLSTKDSSTPKKKTAKKNEEEIDDEDE